MRQPPDNHGEISRWRLDEPSQLRQLRAELTEAISDEELSERLLVVVTELAGNALVHGRPPVVVALHHDGYVIVDVADGAAELPPVVDPGRPSGAGGLGLPLAERLASQVGWYPGPAGKHVWAAFE